MLQFMKFDQLFKNENLERNQREQYFMKLNKKMQPVIETKTLPKCTVSAQVNQKL